MTRKKMLGSQVKRLLAGVSDHGRQHLLEVETDLVQTTFLLGEAIEKLGGSFFALHAAVSAQQAEMDLLIESNESIIITEEKREQLRCIQSEISSHINSAVTGLQFQDLTGQLLARTVQRIVGLREVLSALGVEGDGLPNDGGDDQIITMLNGINMNLDEQNSQLKNLLRKAVHQHDMDSGEIELF
jgi:hypothetical protein